MPHNRSLLSPNALRNRQVDRLRKYLRTTVLPFSAHYGALFARERIHLDALRTPDDLRRIPLTSKSDFAATSALSDPVRAFVLVPDKAILRKRWSSIASGLLHGKAAVTRKFEREFRPLLLTSTTGRSAEPVPFLYTAHDIDNLRLAGARVMRVCDTNREMRMLNLFPFAPHLAFWITHYASEQFGVFMVGTGGGKVMGTDGNLRMIRKLKPDVLIGMPTFLYHVLSAAAADGVALPNLKKLVLGGEKAPVGMRRKLRALAAQLGAAKIDVLRTYGFTEAKLAWSECPFSEEAGSAGYHVDPDLALIEIVDPQTGEPRGEGEPGEIVFTPLNARGTVVVRYRTGDCIDGGLFHEPCLFCGREVPRLVGEIARHADVRELRMEKLKGTLVDFNQLEHALDNVMHIGTWQIELRKRNDDPLEVDELVLHAERIDDFDENRLRLLLSERFASEFELHPNRIEFHTGTELRSRQGVGTRLKEERVIDRRPVNGSGTMPVAASASAGPKP